MISSDIQKKRKKKNLQGFMPSKIGKIKEVDTFYYTKYPFISISSIVYNLALFWVIPMECWKGRFSMKYIFRSWYLEEKKKILFLTNIFTNLFLWLFLTNILWIFLTHFFMKFYARGFLWRNFWRTYLTNCFDVFFFDEFLTNCFDEF